MKNVPRKILLPLRSHICKFRMRIIHNIMIFRIFTKPCNENAFESDDDVERALSHEKVILDEFLEKPVEAAALVLRDDI